VGQDERCIEIRVAGIREDEIYTEMNAAFSSSLPNAVYTQTAPLFIEFWRAKWKPMKWY
jgi:hypothetical protein